jgi:predicted kinase
MKRHLIILRGVPGCGKSTVAEFLAMYVDGIGQSSKYTICCADDFFMKDGEYKFNPKALGIAHKVCTEKCEKAMIAGEERVIVANTSTTEKELKPYMELAEKHGYMVFSLIVENRHGGTNVHNVPEESLTKMVERFSVRLK